MGEEVMGYVPPPPPPMPRVFYRYIRPQRFNEKRMELTTLPKGGICLRFESLPEGDLFFTYARCHPSDHFNKDVAKLIADDRAKVAHEEPRVLLFLRHLPDTQNTDQLVSSVLSTCRKADIATQHRIIQVYMQHEYMSFAEALQELYTSNLQQERRAAAWKRANADIWKTTYESLNK